MIKRKLIIIAALSMTLLLILASAGATFAWFVSQSSITVERSGGSVLTQYFHCGTGTEDDPYVITRPLHYCNLVMLYAANPEFGDSNFIDNSLYFRIGSKDLNNDGVDELTDFSVFNYKDNGTTDNTASDTLNMAIYSEGLFPVGSAVKPFMANFDGSGLTVKNLTVIGSSTVNNVTYKTPDIGIFGYVSQDANIGNLYVGNFTINLADVDGSAIYQTSTTDMTHINHDDKAYVGYIAGHIITGAQINNVYVNDCKIIGGNAAECGFGYFGHVEDESGVEVTTLGSEIATQRVQGDEAGFGGSLDMKTMLERLQRVWDNAAVPGFYSTFENIIIDENNNTWKSTSEGSGTINYRNPTYQYRYYTTPFAGKYYYYERNDMTNYQFMCMYGETSRNPKTVNTYTVTSTDVDALYIKNGVNYLTATSSFSLSAVTVQAGASKWIYDDNGRLFTYIDRNGKYEIYYLVRSGLSGVTLSQTAGSVWVRDTDGALYTTVGGYNYYLDYSASGWFITSVKEYYSISDGNGHYLSCNNTPAVINVNSEAESVRWQMKNTGNAYIFYTVINDTVYYLVCDGTLTMSTTENDWVLDNSGYYTETISNIVYVLAYNNGNWSIFPVGKHISDSGHYLSANTNAVIDSTDTANATVWQVVETNGTCQIYTRLNTLIYYLSCNNTGGLTVSQLAYNWTKSGNSYYTAKDNVNYYIRYSNGWEAYTPDYQVICFEDINNLKHYLRATGVNTFADTTDVTEATKFYFSDTSSGTISYNYNSTKCNLGVSLCSFSNTDTTWIYTNNILRADGTDYYLVYNNGWKIVFYAENYYTISSGNNYFNITSNNSYGTNPGAGDYRDQNGNTYWHFSNIINTSLPAGTISTSLNGTTYYLNGAHTDASSSTCGGNTPESNTISIGTRNTTTWANSSGVLQGNNVRIIYNNGWGAVNTSTTATTLTFSATAPTSVIVITVNEAHPTVSISNNEIPTTTISSPTTVSHALSYENTTDKIVVKTTQTGVNGGYQTYIPLRIATDAEIGWFDASDPYRVSRKNTGYIISGARLEDSTVIEDGQKAAGDIRISYFPISSISGSYANNAFSNIYTIDAAGNHVKNDTSDVYTTARNQLLASLNGSASVYGLHFMDSTISKDHLLVADKAVILNTEYDNYEMPLDSIDFRVVERGTISFFAGEYFTNNNSFFSLHQVFRDEADKITAIKEISEIYQNTEHESNRPYIYKFADNTYTNADGSYTGATSLDAAYTATPLFRTSWITAPTGMTSGGNKVYYFEIPVNKGEFCLGSVPGKIGAYLIYLDIATNGGDAISTIISAEGNDVSNSFKAEYRYSPDKLGTDYYSVMLFSISAPQGTNANSFSVDVNFIDDPAQTEYINGVYTITILNTSGEDLTLDVYLADDDRVQTNEFLYAYKIIYTNENHTNQTILTVLDSEYWQSMASFNIPSSGVAEELGYQ